MAYAGAHISNLVTFIGQPSTLNTFYQMHNGIVCENSVLDIIHNKFSTLWTNGILGKSCDLTIHGGNEFIGEVTVPGIPNLPTMQNGVYALSCDLDINLNNFNKRIRYGINSRDNLHGEFIRISQNSFAEDVNATFADEHCGICIERSAAAATVGIPTHNEIGLNNFNVRTTNYTAIVVEGVNTATDELVISRNLPINLENLPPFSFVKGIYVRTSNSDNSIVGLNQVNIDGYYQSGNFGVLTFTSNSVNFNINSNAVIGVNIPTTPDPDFANTIHAAIYLRNGDANADAVVCNNTTDYSRDGLHFARGMARVRENKIYNHSYGVLIEPSNVLPMLGLQDGRGNQWLGSYAHFAAIRLENPGQPVAAELCRFWVPESNLLPFLPASTAVSPNPDLELDADLKWFRYRPSLALDYCSQGFVPNGVSEFEMLVAENLFTSLSAEMIWDTKRNLYRKLLENPGLLVGNNTLTTFKNTYQGSPLAAFSQVDWAIRNATRFTTASQENRDTIVLSLAQKTLQVEGVLALTNFDFTLASAAQLQNLEALSLQIGNKFGTISTMDKSRDLQISGYLDAANVINEALQATNVQEQARKDLNRLIIKKLRLTPVSATDYQIILNIAGQAKNVIGAALQEAVLLLSGCDQNNFVSAEVEATYEKNASTNVVESSEKEKIDMQVSPNPSDGKFQLLLNKPINGMLRIVSASGRSVKSLTLVQDQREVAVDISGAPSGVYFLVLQNTDGKVIKTLPVVIH